jgi:hypothetical protein
VELHVEADHRPEASSGELHGGQGVARHESLLLLAEEVSLAVAARHIASCVQEDSTVSRSATGQRLCITEDRRNASPGARFTDRRDLVSLRINGEVFNDLNIVTAQEQFREDKRSDRAHLPTTSLAVRTLAARSRLTGSSWASTAFTAPPPSPCSGEHPRRRGPPGRPARHGPRSLPSGWRSPG